MDGSIKNWSPFQTAIFDAVKNTNDSLTIEAVAGSGKSSTIIEAVNYVPKDKSVVFLAFNKVIADELKRRITASNCKCQTLHAAGFAAWRKFLGNDAWDCKVNSSKTKDIVKDLLSSDDRWKYGGQMSKLIGLAKGVGLVPRNPIGGYESLKGLVEDENSAWEDLIEFYNLDSDMCSIEVARAVLTESIVQAREAIDYDDMLFLPVVANAPFEKYDVVFVDEVQDLSSLQHEMVSRMVKERVIGVGDRFQSIYQWRGAMHNSMDSLSERFKCRSLPLSISYRCPQSVVKRAQAFVPHIQWHESAPEGLVIERVDNWPLTDFLQNDAILCRNSKPLIQTAFLLIRNKVPCRVLGRDIGQGLVSLVRKMKATTIEGLEIKLEAYRVREVGKAKGDEAKIASIDDRLETLSVFIDEVALGGSVEDLIRAIESLFSDDARDMLTLSTIHKFKGGERDRVFILDAHLYQPSKWAKRDWEKIGERNLQYVACTRARRELYYIASDSLRIPTPLAEAVPAPALSTDDSEAT